METSLILKESFVVPNSFSRIDHDKCFNLKQIFASIFLKLQPLFKIDCAALILYDEDKRHIEKSFIFENKILVLPNTNAQESYPIIFSKFTKMISEFEFPVLKSSFDWIEEFGENHLLNNHTADYKFHCYIPIESNNVVLGTLELHNYDVDLSAEGLTFCCNIAEMIAGMLSTLTDAPQQHNVLSSDQGNYKKDSITILLEALIKITNKEELVAVAENYFKTQYNAIGVEILQPERELLSKLGDIVSVPTIIATNELTKLGLPNSFIECWIECGIVTAIALPLLTTEYHLSLILLGFCVKTPSQPIEINAMNLAATQILYAFARNDLSYKLLALTEEIEKYKTDLNEFMAFSLPVPVANLNYSGIVGDSPEMNQVYRLIDSVKSSDTTALILGETGTGKELIAKAIHNGSSRNKHSLIRVNCAAIPPNLIESELFGHEKGSFTGATEKRLGKFELAHNGTIFLDEIGELPLDLQVKLLRVLQEKELERVGGRETISVNVRVISATNRNLLEEVQHGRFRQDLYYRLNVFPIVLPPLRQRKKDIPQMAQFFLERFALKSNRKAVEFSRKAMADMIAYNWPGNVRELEHMIERQVVLSKEPLIKDMEIPKESTYSLANQIPGQAIKTIVENERDHIFSVLELCGGKISGAGGAAKLLGVPATTLNSKIKKLGLAKKHSFK